MKGHYAVYSGTRNLYPYMVGAAKSLVEHSDVERIFFLIEDEKFPTWLPDIVTCIDVSDQKCFPPDGPNMKSKFTYMALVRAALCFILPSYVKKVLSLDVDTIVKRNVSDIWDLPMDDCYLSAAIEPARSTNGLQYVNIGVTLFDLEILRESFKAEEVIRVLNKREYPWLEQDVFSYLCQGYISEMPSTYNANRFVRPWKGEPKIVHFAGYSEWNYFAEVVRYQEKTWEEVLTRRKAMEKEGLCGF